MLLVLISFNLSVHLPALLMSIQYLKFEMIFERNHPNTMVVLNPFTFYSLFFKFAHFNFFSNMTILHAFSFRGIIVHVMDIIHFRNKIKTKMKKNDG